MGINGVALNWFESYLTNRTQKVDIKGSLSTSEKLKISVLQGTILGPILFLCYINDFPQATDMLSRLFADDTACTKSHQNLNTLIDLVNIEIQKMANWFRANKMAVNISKTKYIIFHGKGKKVEMGNSQIVFNNNEIGKPINPSLITPLERVYNANPNKESKTYKLLGVHLDEFLSFKEHIDITCNKLNKSLYCINRSKNFLTKKAMKSLYFALVHPHLLYCINIYSCTSKSNLKRLIILQKKAVRTIHLAPHNTHTSELFLESKILPLEKLIKFSKLMFMHSIEYEYGLQNFQSSWIKNRERNQNQNPHLRNANDYYLPHPRIEHFKNIPLYSFGLEWNMLNDELKWQFNRITFKIALKNYLFSEME